METRSRKRKADSDLSKDSNSNKDFLSVHVQNENNVMSTGIRTEDWVESAPRRHEPISDNNIPIISQENILLKSAKRRETRALTLLAKVDTSEDVEYVRIIPKMEEGVKLVKGVHKCIGHQETNIGANNVFVTVLIEHGQQTRNVRVGETLGYAKIVDKHQAALFNAVFTISMKSGISKLKLEKNVYLEQDETVVVEATVESLPPANVKNYPIQFESTNKSLEVDKNGFSTIQKGNSAKIRLRNVSEKTSILRNGDILGNAKSLITEEFIEKIQCSNDKSRVSNSKSLPLPLDASYNFVFLEIETLRASNSSGKQITQIGCCSTLNIPDAIDEKFFTVIEPSKLNHYLDNFQIAGDLLQFLHLQRNESGQFEYRKQFEIVEEGVEIPRCITEKEALQSLARFLNWSKFIIISIKKETIGLVIERMKHYEIDFQFCKDFVGFCTWDSFLEKTFVKDMEQDFDDWYIEKVNNNIPSSLNAETVARMHKEVIKRISETCHSSSSSTSRNEYNPLSSMILPASSPSEFLFNSAANSQIEDSEEHLEFLELSNSFRPNFPTTITMISLETLEISSDEEDSLLPTSQMKSKPDVQNSLLPASQPPTLKTSRPAADVMDIWISDDEPDEGIPSQTNITEPDEVFPSQTNITEPEAVITCPSNISQPSTSGVQSALETGFGKYCLVCNRNFGNRDALQNHLLGSKKHRTQAEKVLNKSCRIGTTQEKDEQILWFDLINRLSMLSLSRPKKHGAVTRKKDELESLTSIALHFEKKARLIVDHIEKELSLKTLANRKQHAPMQFLRLIGSLSQRNEIFKEMFERRIVATFAHAFQVSRDLTDFIKLRKEWMKTGTFHFKTLHEIDKEMRLHSKSWMSFF